METKVTLVVAPLNGGKTSCLEHLIDKAHEKGLTCGGVLALANPGKTWYRLKDLCSSQSKLALSAESELGPGRIGRFSIDAEAFAWANAILEQSLETNSMVVFDEIGKLELAEGGLAPSFRKALAQDQVIILAAVRDVHVESVVEHFGLAAYRLTLLQVQKEERTNE